MAKLKALFLYLSSAICISGSIGGGLLYHFLKPRVFSYLLSSVSVDSKTATNTTELYKNGYKDYQCVLTYPTPVVGQVDSEQKPAPLTLVDPNCKIYSVDNKDESTIKLKDLVPPKSAEITQKDKITETSEDSKNKAMYQIAIEKYILEQFSSSYYSDLEVKLIPNSESVSDMGNKQYITLKSHFKFDNSTKGSGATEAQSTTGKSRSVIVKITSDKHTCTDENHKEFKITTNDKSESGYRLFKLSKNGTETIKNATQIHSKHVRGLGMDAKHQVKCSDLEKNKFYVLRSPAAKEKWFDLDGIYYRNIELECDNCTQKVTAQIVRFLAANPKAKTKKSD